MTSLAVFSFGVVVGVILEVVVRRVRKEKAVDAAKDAILGASSATESAREAVEAAQSAGHAAAGAGELIRLRKNAFVVLVSTSEAARAAAWTAVPSTPARTGALITNIIAARKAIANARETAATLLTKGVFVGSTGVRLNQEETQQAFLAEADADSAKAHLNAALSTPVQDPRHALRVAAHHAARAAADAVFASMKDAIAAYEAADGAFVSAFHLTLDAGSWPTWLAQRDVELTASTASATYATAVATRATARVAADASASHAASVRGQADSSR